MADPRARVLLGALCLALAACAGPVGTTRVDLVGLKTRTVPLEAAMTMALARKDEASEVCTFEQTHT
jgi:hypothetical protein